MVTQQQYQRINGAWSLSQRSSGERRGTPWTGRQSITGPHRDKQPHTRSHPLLRTILETPINLTCMFLGLIQYYWILKLNWMKPHLVHHHKNEKNTAPQQTCLKRAVHQNSQTWQGGHWLERQQRDRGLPSWNAPLRRLVFLHRTTISYRAGLYIRMARKETLLTEKEESTFGDCPKVCERLSKHLEEGPHSETWCRKDYALGILRKTCFSLVVMA